MSHVSGLFTCPSQGEPMVSHDHVFALAGVGLSRDRYATGRGAYSHVKPQKIRHVTLIAQEDIDAANIDLKTIGMLPFDPIETRRNILTQGVALNSLVGKSFFVGNVRMQGIERADPCMRPGALVRKRGFPEAFAGRGGLRAQVLVNGRISIEDLITT